MVEKKDIISLLPDNLLHHILSYLPTEDAVSTCLLSKRWQNLWMSTTNLEFYCSYHYYEKDFNKFVRFVDGVLHFHSSCILRFNLSFPFSSKMIDPTLLESWISAAAERRVQELHLSFPPTILSLPHRLCTSTFLTVLRVSSCSYLQLPPVICLSSLKHLSLELVKFSDGCSFNRLLSGLPLIEELKLVDCQWVNIRNAIISLPTLKRLTLLDLCISWTYNNLRLKVNAENLRYLTCTSDLSIDLVIDNPTLLEDAFINITYIYSMVAAENLFSGLCFSKSLKIGKGSLKRLDECICRNIKFPQFVCLTTLEVGWVFDGVVLMDILRSSPVLETLVIGKVYSGTLSKKPHPLCFEVSLKEFSLLCFDGRPVEVSLVKSLLSSAKVLERIKLYCTENLCIQQEKLENIKKKLEDVRNKLKSSSQYIVSNNCVVQLLNHRKELIMQL